MQLIWFGTGKNAKRCHEIFKLLKNYEIIGVFDSNCEKWGEQFEGHTIQSPVGILSLQYDKILVASTFFEEIKENLDKLGIDADKLAVEAKVFLQAAFYKQKYNDFYSTRKKELIPRLMNNEKLVVYTAIFGNYDHLLEPEYKEDDVDYICFTDNIELSSNTWKIVLMERKFDDPVRCAKEFKILPHLFLKDYNNSAWVDGDTKVLGNIRDYYQEQSGSTGISFSLHPDRNCIYEEAEICMFLNKDKNDIIIEQVKKYKEKGYPLNYGLIVGHVIFRKHYFPDIIRLMEKWWSEIQQGSRRDQLSFNYASWQEDILYDVFDEQTYNNKNNKIIRNEGHKN